MECGAKWRSEGGAGCAGGGGGGSQWALIVVHWVRVALCGSPLVCWQQQARLLLLRHQGSSQLHRGRECGVLRGRTRVQHPQHGQTCLAIAALHMKDRGSLLRTCNTDSV